MMIEFESTSLERHLRAIVRELDYSYWALPTGELVISHGQEGSTLVFVSQADDVVVHLHTTLRGAVDLGEAAALSRFITAWNADCLYPTAVLDYDEAGLLVLSGQSHFSTGTAPMHDQLAAFVPAALNGAEVLISVATREFPTLAQEPELVLAPDDAAIQPAFTLDLLAAALPQIGIDRFHSDGEICLFALVNSIACTFTLDSGPSLIITGRWDLNADEDDFTRLFLICNDWNRADHSATAYCRSTDDGLHIHVDVPTLTGAGLNQGQLLRVLSHSLDAILHAIDDIAREFCGSSPVKWA